MMQRCYDLKKENFKYYGGRGVTVCLAWHKFENFLADMGERPKGLTIDRINPDGNYEPGNCRWSKNKAFNRRNTNWFVVAGETLPLSQAAKKMGIWNTSIYKRLRQGWSKEEIVEYYRDGYPANRNPGRVFLTYGGRTMSQKDWARVLGCHTWSIGKRLKKGWPFDKIVEFYQ